jgi:hypothetical protein
LPQDEKLTIEEFHKKMAVETNNAIWSALDKSAPTADELAEALDMAHASRYHWSKIGKPINLARADYMISRVWSAMKKPEPAVLHAQRCLAITQREGIKDWDLAFAYEALTRAYAVAGDRKQYEKHLKLTTHAIAEIKEDEDRRAVQNELDKISFK